MSIQIIDNFEVRVQKAIDNRFVVGTGQFYTNKDDIDYKYAGLRVWDLDLSIPYVWTGVTWSSEATASITGSGTIGTIPKFIGLTNNIGDSVIKESSSNIGIGLVPTEKLDVNGNVKATKFIGLAWSVGSGLTNINLGTNGTNVIGTIGLPNIQNGSPGNILIGGASTPQWSDPSSITVGNATNATNVYHQEDTSTTSGRKIPFINSTGASGNVGLRTAPGFTFQPDNTTLYVDGGIGIGTSAGSYKLRISGNSYFDGLVGINATPTGYNLTVGGTARITNSIRLGTYLNLSEATFGNYLFMNNTNGTIVGIFFQNVGTGYTGSRSLYMDGSGDLITGGNGGNRFNNFRLENAASNGGNAYFYIRDQMGIGTSTFAWTTSGSRFHEDSNTSWVSGSNGTSKLAVNGGISCTWIVTLSDRRLKKNITPINTSLDKVLKLNAVEYEWNEHTDVKNYGFIAQEVEEIIPEVIRYYEDNELEGGKMTIHYESIIAHLTKAIQEQQEIINSFEERLKKLE